MKVGINLLLWTDKPSSVHAPLLQRIKNWGFDGVEFPVLAMDSAGIRELGSVCNSLGLKRSALVALSAADADPSHPDPKLRSAAVDELKRCVDKTRAVGADILVGPLHQGLGRFTGAGPTDDDWNRSSDVIRTVAEHAAAMHVDLAIEPLNRFEMFLTNTVEAAARFVKTVNMPNVGILADTHHSNIEEEKPAEAWSRVMKQVNHVHISENHRGIPGKGHAANAAMFHAVRKSGYDRWLTIEAFGLSVPGLIQPLHLWRPFFDKEEDVAVLGLRHIRENWARAAG